MKTEPCFISSRLLRTGQREDCDPRRSAVGENDGVLHAASDRHILNPAEHVGDHAAAMGSPRFFFSSTVPFAASRARKLPLVSAVRSTPPAVGVTDATIGVSVLYVHITLPLSASMAATWPNRCGSCSPNPFAEPMKGLGGSCLRLSGPASLIVVPQSMVGTNKVLRGGE